MRGVVFRGGLRRRVFWGCDFWVEIWFRGWVGKKGRGDLGRGIDIGKVLVGRECGVGKE